MCPHCRQNAPIVYRGAMAYCTACGKPRIPLTGSGVNTAGRPHKVGGSVARGLGWVTLAVGLTLALSLGALFQAIFPAGVFGYLLGAIIALFSTGIGFSLLKGGKSLQKSGVEKERFTREQAIFALARNRGGMLSAMDVSQALNLPLPAADELLTTFAKEDPERVRLELDDSGGIYYLFPQIALTPGPRVAGPGVRVAEPAAANVISEEPAEEDERAKAKRSL
ncbi:hypothetical protein [Pendulispora albinea]|uniref:Uncharacterized protein n=1 Tax=Pendulispora albinea TaxID=2741071 RepID=A0ABZ2LQ31_9BACT